MNRLRPTLTVLLVTALSGCYSYTLALDSAPVQGTPVRVHLQQPSSFELLQVTAHNIDRVDGEMVRTDASEMALSATWLHALTGNGFNGGLWTVEIDRSNVASLEVKRLSWLRTGIVVALGALATHFGFDALGGTAGGSGLPGGGGQIN